jgi:hypothetical protein
MDRRPHPVGNQTCSKVATLNPGSGHMLHGQYRGVIGRALGLHRNRWATSVLLMLPTPGHPALPRGMPVVRSTSRAGVIGVLAWIVRVVIGDSAS